MDAPVPVFPSFRASQPQGGMKNMGPGVESQSVVVEAVGKRELTWVRNNHTYKAGAEMRIEAYPATSTPARTESISSRRPRPDFLPPTGRTCMAGTVGFPYASFLLGAVDVATISNPTSLRPVKSQWGGFAQDSWKVTRKFTLDYGLRYDYRHLHQR